MQKLNEIPYKFSPYLREISKTTSRDAIRSLRGYPQGLDGDQIRERRLRFGSNVLAQEEKVKWHKQLLNAFINPFNFLLTGLAIVSYITDDPQGALTMAAMVFISVFLMFFQELRSSVAAEKLKAMVRTTVSVIRRTVKFQMSGGQDEWIPSRIDVPISELVPGDIIYLSAGDMIPADVRVITSKDLFISQSALTGESIPVEKVAAEETGVDCEVLELKNICFMGSTVVSGTATAIVLKTGGDTFLGCIAKSLTGTRVQTSFDLGIHRFTWLMLRFMMVMVPAVLLINGFAKHNWVDAFMFAIAVAVGLTPEMLPMIVTVNLAKGALSMSKKKVIVKRLNSIQNFGAMDTLCTDKTGTLTQDRVVLLKYVDASGTKNDRVLKYAYLNSNYQTGLKNLLDVAVLREMPADQTQRITRDYRKIDEIPFDFVRRRMSVVVEEERKRHVLICKGALEEVLSVSTQGEFGGKINAITPAEKEQCLRIAYDLNEDGLRVIAVAYKEMPPNQENYSLNDESQMILLGFLAFLDPPKESSKEAIAGLRARGVEVKVLTGDNDIVTKKIAREVGLDADKLLRGQDIEKMSDEELVKATETTVIFAKLTPAQKERIVKAMHVKGHVVGFMGDGINDAAALKAADVGISVDNAVDIAKESADIILLEKSLLVLEDGVTEGRKVFGNIIKYIKMGASSNFGNVFSVLGASFLLPFLPMKPVQLLTQNLLYDLSQTAIPFDSVDAEYLEKPRKWEIGEIGRFMVCMGPVSSLFDYATFAVMWYVFKANTPEMSSLFQSGWFIEGLLSQTLIVHMIRTKKIPFIQSRASAPLLITSSIIMALGIYFPFSSWGSHIGLRPLPQSYFVWLVFVLLSYCVLTQIVKSWFIKRYGYN